MYELIAQRAYHIWQREGKCELESWMRAERELRGEDSRHTGTNMVVTRADINSRQSATLAVLYAELAKAQAEQDAEGIVYIQETIAEVLKPFPAGPIDEPLLPALKKAQAKKAR